MMQKFWRYEIVLRPESAMSGWLGHLLHGALFRQAEGADPALSARLHSLNQKPFSLHYQEREGLVLFYLNTWEPALARLIPGVFAAGTRVQLSQTGADVVSCRCVQTMEHAAEPAQYQFARLTFQSPACFRSGGQPLLFPEGRLLAESLCGRLRPADGGAPEAKALSESLRPTRYALKTREISYGAFHLTGFTGWCEYAVLSEPEQWARLLGAAPYTGVGYKTAQGMGAVRVELRETK